MERKLNGSQHRAVVLEPEADYFPNIDASILIDSTLHCLQYFVSKDGFHFFDYRTFEEYFLNELPKPGDTGQDAMGFTGEGKDDAMETDEPNSSDAKDDVLEAPAS